MPHRRVLRDALTAALPAKFRVIPYPSLPDAVAFVAVVLEPRTIRALREAPRSGYLEMGCDVWVLVSNDMKADARENALEDALVRVLNVLDGIPAVLVDEAERTTAGDVFHAYKITTRPVAKKE